MNPYKIDEPCAIGVSGGRSSAYMLFRILETHDFILPDYIKPIFCNTGIEFEQTYSFLNQISLQWDVDIIWLEYEAKRKFKIVDYETASRNGEPFDALIKDKKMLPNPAKRFCSAEMKVLTTDRYMKSIGMDNYLMAVGIRADEPRRVAKHKAKDNYAIPIASESGGKQTIKQFWESQPFDLNMPMNPDGSCDFTNCTLCFMKALPIKTSIIKTQGQQVAQWWINKEEEIGHHFRFDHPSYKQIIEYEDDQIALFDEDESIPCFCGD